MNINVKVEKWREPALVEIDEGEGPILYTRVWMGMVPPKGLEPGYACVVGEVYDDDPRQKPRPKILLDEAQALNPDDWSKDVVESYHDSFLLTLRETMVSYLPPSHRIPLCTTCA